MCSVLSVSDALLMSGLSVRQIKDILEAARVKCSGPSFACSAPEPERNRQFDSMRPHSREVSYAGCTEKSELEALLEKTRTSAKSSDSTTEVCNVRALMIAVPRSLRRQLGVCVGGLATSTECGNWTSASCPTGGPGSSTPPSAEARRPRGRLKDQGRVRGFRGPRRMGYCATGTIGVVPCVTTAKAA